MPFLTINGIQVKVDLRAGARKWSEGGYVERMFDRSATKFEANEKRSWRLETENRGLTRTEADALSALVRGRGHTWKFAAASDLWSSKGLTTSATSGTLTAGVAGGKFDKKLQITAAGYGRWTPTGKDALTGDYTLSVWRLESGTFRHYVRRSDGTIWREGSTSGSPTAPFLLVASGYVQLGDPASGATQEFSDMVALPFAVPDSWPAQMFAYTRAFPNLPFLEMAGDVSSAAVVSVLGTVDEEPVQGFMSAGTWHNGRRLEFDLHEA